MHALTDEELTQFAALCWVMAHPARVRILLTLANREEATVSHLCGVLNAPQPTVSHHVGILRRHGLVSSRRQGKLRHYRLSELVAAAGGLLSIEGFGLRLTLEKPRAT